MSYLLHVSVLLTGLYLFYWLLLRRETFFRLNRWLLVGSMLLALGLPLLKVPPQWSLRTAEVAAVNPSSSPRLEAPSGAVLSAPAEPVGEVYRPESEVSARVAAWGLPEWFLAVYFLGVAVFAGTFLLQLIIVLRKRQGLEAIQDGRFTIYELTDDTPPFSFANWIFLNPAKYDPDTYVQILEHEKLHVAQAHTLDKILAELVVILLWFNPFAWMMRTAITKNLEYLIDAEMLSAGTDARSYQLSLVQVAVPRH
ncbi:MAG: M56 family metallopeptidase, partial [Bacteroidota bacterium]